MSQDTQSVILIVDDTPIMRFMLMHLLADQDYRIEFALNGGEALEKAARLMPDLILLDVMMPVLDGFEVCRRLRADPQLGEVPIILITSLHDRESRLLGIEAGADDFVSKPLDHVELQARVRGILRLNRYRRLLVERVQRQQVAEETQRHEHELALLKETERLKDQFISDVSHELRTPLSVITLLAGNLETLYAALDDQQRRAMIRDIRSQTRTLNELVDNILEIARINGGRISSERRPVNLALLAREEADKQRPLAERKRHTLNLLGPGELRASGDAGQLRQIIRNLLNNAIKYTADGGRITCECRELRVGDLPVGAELVWPDCASLTPGRWAAMRVADTGIGIAAEDLTRVFERFYRVKTQGNISGTGLGLAIAHGLALAQGGRITVASSVGVGSTFAFYIPLLKED